MKPDHITGWDLARLPVVYSSARSAETFHLKGCRFAPRFMQERETTFALAIGAFRRPCEECIGRRHRFSLVMRVALAILRADRRSTRGETWYGLRR